MKQVWKTINGYEGLYQVNNLGQIKSLNFGRTGKQGLLKTTINKHGYECVHLSKNKGDQILFVHVLVAKAFIDNPNPSIKTQVNHIDGNKLNNHLDNLEWVSPKENTNHAIKNGLRERMPIRNPKGKSNKFSKTIGQYSKQGDLIKVWFCISDAARFYRCNPCSIVNCAKGRKKSANGYVWKEYTYPNYPSHI